MFERQNRGLGSILGRFQNETESSAHKTSTQRRKQKKEQEQQDVRQEDKEKRAKTEMEGQTQRKGSDWVQEEDNQVLSSSQFRCFSLAQRLTMCIFPS